MAKEGEITLYAEWPGKGRPCRIRDISPHGMQIVAGEPLPKGQVIKLEGDLLGAVARVANCRIRHQGSLLRYAVGLEFLTLRFHHLHGTFVSLTV